VVIFSSDNSRQQHRYERTPRMAVARDADIPRPAGPECVQFPSHDAFADRYRRRNWCKSRSSLRPARHRRLKTPLRIASGRQVNTISSCLRSRFKPRSAKLAPASPGNTRSVTRRSSRCEVARPGLRPRDFARHCRSAPSRSNRRAHRVFVNRPRWREGGRVGRG
jgi:hypothetical protein